MYEWMLMVGGCWLGKFGMDTGSIQFPSDLSCAASFLHTLHSHSDPASYCARSFGSSCWGFQILTIAYLLWWLGSLEKLDGEDNSGWSRCFCFPCIAKSSTYEFGPLVLVEVLLGDLLFYAGFLSFNCSHTMMQLSWSPLLIFIKPWGSYSWLFVDGVQWSMMIQKFLQCGTVE